VTDWKVEFKRLEKEAEKEFLSGNTSHFHAIENGWQNAADTYGDENHKDFYRVAYFSIQESDYFDADWFAQFNY